MVETNQWFGWWSYQEGSQQLDHPWSLVYLKTLERSCVFNESLSLSTNLMLTSEEAARDKEALPDYGPQLGPFILVIFGCVTALVVGFGVVNLILYFVLIFGVFGCLTSL